MSLFFLPADFTLALGVEHHSYYNNITLSCILLLKKYLCTLLPCGKFFLYILKAKNIIPESAHAEMGSISDAEHELQLVEGKIHDAEQVCYLRF